MKLDTILGDLVLAHLDPDHSMLWNIWENELPKSLLKGVDKKQARERLLYLLHLNNRGDLTDEETLNELKEFIKSTADKQPIVQRRSGFQLGQITTPNLTRKSVADRSIRLIR